MKRNLLVIVLICATKIWAVTGAQIAVYNGPGAWAEGIQSFEKFCDWKGITHEQVTPLDVNSVILKDYYQGIFMPGGDAYYYKLAIDSAGLQHIRDLVSGGGFYMGMCAGSYFASDSIEWEGGIYDYQLGLFNGFARGAIDTIAPWPNYVMTDVTMNMNNPINVYSSGRETILYYGGPVYEPKPGQNIDTLATWDSWYNLPAIINFTYGNGRVFFSGPHPETEEDSQRDGNNFADSYSDNGSDWPFLWSVVDWLMKKPITDPRFWINELHYDDIGVDANEFIELIVPQNFSDFSNLHLILYDGATGLQSSDHPGTTFTQGATQDGFRLLSRHIAGLPDGTTGMALIYKGNVIQFLSYEGSFTAVDGPAAGMTSSDIGVAEDGTDSEGLSLQLSGQGDTYRSFTWNMPTTQTEGQPNSNAQIDQTLPVTLLTFRGSGTRAGITLEWQTASELENAGFIIERARAGNESFRQIAHYKQFPALRGVGNSNRVNSYSFTDLNVIPETGYRYRLLQQDYAGGINLLGELSVTSAEVVPGGITLKANYPNPFNPSTVISYQLDQNSYVRLDVYDMHGRLIRTLERGEKKAGTHSVRFSARGLASGIYYYRLTTPQKVYSRKMMLLR